MDICFPEIVFSAQVIICVISSCLQMNSCHLDIILGFWWGFLLCLINDFDDGKIFGPKIMCEHARKDCMKWLL